MRYSPMLAELAPGPFDSPDHIFEPKWDGVRCLAYVSASGYCLVGRSGADITELFPEFRRGHFPGGSLVMDGEMVCGDGKKKSFPLIQARIHREDAFSIRLGARTSPATYMVFDILELEETDLTSSGQAFPLWRREELLSTHLAANERVRLTPFIEAEGAAVFNAWQALGYEGVMAKHLQSAYTPGKRSPCWQKIKAARVEEFYAVALTPGQGSRQDSFGAMVLASLEGGALVHRGEVGSGFSEADLKAVLDRARDALPALPITIKGARWISPLKCRVKYLDQTEDGKLRFPVFAEML
jgi:bifunctional non-homologous end joining protein LigD